MPGFLFILFIFLYNPMAAINSFVIVFSKPFRQILAHKVV